MAAPFKISSLLPGVLAIIFAALAALLVAGAAVTRIEQSAQSDVNRELVEAGLTWARVDVDGLQVKLGGTAPDEATRFRALRIAGRQVDAARIVDTMGVEDPDASPPPRFSMEILRNEDGISLIGLIPRDADRDAYLESASDAAENTQVTDLLQTSAHPIPDGWHQAINFAMTALSELPRAKISASADGVVVTAMAASEEAKTEFERALRRSAPDGLPVTISISAPRPVFTPFTLRFVIEDGSARFDACAADTKATQLLILETARKYGLPKDADCPIGLGTPSATWGAAVRAAIGAVGELGAGTVTFSDGDITLVGTETMNEEDFDRTVARLDSVLPELFTLHAVLPRPVVEEALSGDDPVEFLATLSLEGVAEIRGRVGNDLTRSAVESFAKSEFGVQNVRSAIRSDTSLPEGWPIRVLAGLEALSLLDEGNLTVHPANIDLRGITGSKDASAQASQVLSAKLGEGQNFSLDIRYEEALDPLAGLPTPEECIAKLNGILAERKITFEPGSAEIEETANETIDRIAEVLPDCRRAEMEIAGHTDSQGREVMNLSLSQARADAVLNAIMARRVLVSNLSAKGYGESQPIADNESETGREANRRIEFALRVLEEVVADERTSSDGSDSAETISEDAENPETSGGATEQSDEIPPEAGRNGQADSVPAPEPEDRANLEQSRETGPEPVELEAGGAGPSVQTDIGGLGAPDGG